MSNVIRSISSIIDKDYKSFAMYTLEGRALPSYIDGLKPTGRKLVYSMINQYKGKKIKVSELGSSIPSYGYHHGESSAMGAVVTLSADWQNNVPIFKGYGSFGTRLIQSAAAPRYIFCDLNPDFSKYFCDENVCTSRNDVEHPEPQQYLPIIPWVLVNGVEGIAVGFACRYLPHNPKDIAKACIKAVKGTLKSNHVIPVTFPGFTGTITQEEHNKIISYGTVTRIKRNTWLISEVPWGFDREKFFLTMESMMDSGKIQDFEDECADSKFKFTVKMDGTQDEKCAKDPIAYFKLSRAYSENYTALNEHGKLIIFNNKLEIIEKFVEFRIKKVEERIQADVIRQEKELFWFETKMKFISDVVNKKINILDYKKQDLLYYCSEEYKVDKDMASRLIGTSIYEMTSDVVEELEQKIKKHIALIDETKLLDPKQVYLDMLHKIA